MSHKTGFSAAKVLVTYFEPTTVRPLVYQKRLACLQTITLQVQITFAALVASLLLGCAATSSRLQQTPDKTVQLGRTSGGFRIISHGLDLAMKAPAGWRVALATEEPLRGDVVCTSPDKETFASVSVRDVYAGDLTAAPDDYLRALRRSVDEKIEMHPAGSVTSSGGHQLPVWRFSSDLWGEHLSTSLIEGKVIVDVEVEGRGETPNVMQLRQVLQAMVASYQPSNHARQPGTSGGG